MTRSPARWRSLVEAIPGAEGLSLKGRDHMKAVGDREFKLAVLDFSTGGHEASAAGKLRRALFEEGAAALLVVVALETGIGQGLELVAAGGCRAPDRAFACPWRRAIDSGALASIMAERR